MSRKNGLAKWNDGFDIVALLERIYRSCNSLDFELYLPVLLSAVTWPDDIPESTRLELVRASIQVQAAGKVPAAEVVLEKIKTQQRAYLKRRLTPHIVSTSLSVSTSWRLYPRIALGHEIRFLSRLDAARPGEELYGVPEDPKSYKKIRLRLDARAVEDAWRRAFDAIDLLRGIWNFGLGRNRYRITFGGHTGKPFNSVLLGPRFTVYDENAGTESRNQGCITPFHLVRPVFDAAELKVIIATERRVCRGLARASYHDAIESGFIRYCRALDEPDLNSSFLSLWSVLEYLSAAGAERYKDMIGRISMLWNRQEPHRSVLNHLRLVRNQQVHAGEGSGLAEALIGQLKFYVENLLVFHLSQGHRFEGLQEAGKFLDLPGGVNELKRQTYLLKSAISVRSKGN